MYIFSKWNIQSQAWSFKALWMFFNKVYRALDRWTSVVHFARKSLLAILCLILKVQLTHGLAWIPSQMFSPFYPTSFFRIKIHQIADVSLDPVQCYAFPAISYMCHIHFPTMTLSIHVYMYVYIYIYVIYISIFLEWHYPSIIQCYAFLCCHYWQSGYRSSPAICKLHFILFYIYHISYDTMYIIFHINISYISYFI